MYIPFLQFWGTKTSYFHIDVIIPNWKPQMKKITNNRPVLARSGLLHKIKGLTKSIWFPAKHGKFFLTFGKKIWYIDANFLSIYLE